MKVFQRIVFFAFLYCLSAFPAQAQNPTHFTIERVSDSTMGYLHYLDGSPDGILNEQNTGYAARSQFVLMAGYSYHPLAAGHLEATVRYRVRYTAQFPGESLPTTFTGLVWNHSIASAAAYGSQGTVSASSHPEGDTGASVVSNSTPQNYYSPPYDEKSKYTRKTVSLSAINADGEAAVDEQGHSYSEGFVDLKAVLDIRGNSGFPQAGAEIMLGAAKSIMVVRPENSGPPLGDDGTILPGFIEPDAYNADGSHGTGKSRFNNAAYTNVDLAYPALIGGKDFGDEIY